LGLIVRYYFKNLPKAPLWRETQAVSFEGSQMTVSQVKELVDTYTQILIDNKAPGSPYSLVYNLFELNFGSGLLDIKADSFDDDPAVLQQFLAPFYNLSFSPRRSSSPEHSQKERSPWEPSLLFEEEEWNLEQKPHAQHNSREQTPYYTIPVATSSDRQSVYYRGGFTDDEVEVSFSDSLLCALLLFVFND
jgi:hypothetical protein